MTTATNIKPGVRMTLEEFFELPETVIPRYELHWGRTVHRGGAVA